MRHVFSGGVAAVLLRKGEDGDVYYEATDGIGIGVVEVDAEYENKVERNARDVDSGRARGGRGRVRRVASHCKGVRVCRLSCRCRRCFL